MALIEDSSFAQPMMRRYSEARDAELAPLELSWHRFLALFAQNWRGCKPQAARHAERYNVAPAPTNRIHATLAIHAASETTAGPCSLQCGVRRSARADDDDPRRRRTAGTPTLSRKALLQAFLATTLAPRRADAVDCLGEAEKAQRLIRTTLAIYADDGDPAPLRPVAKTIAKPDFSIKAVPGAGLLPPERPARRGDAESCQRRPGVRGVRRRVRRL